ncbi:SDR family oxidoreductase [Baekduia alba]|uniref:SDR family oxidoreductase n=1 Tax=Baekduia alba TaxID=2997333 RepID=UPI002340743E|nr:SDR family oxidoreductase [Baekduia alba]
MLPTRSDAVLLTGVTGFVGTAVALRILERSDRQIVALVRAADRREAAERVRGALAEVTPPELLDAYAARCAAVPADLLADGLGLRHGDREEIARRCDEVIHCAASVSFDLPLDLARAVNAAGAARIAELAARVAQRGEGLRRVVHVSTAYVAGDRDGTFGEDDVTRDVPFRNTYEQTKHEAEELLRAWEPALPLQIVRPSIVVGDRTTGWTRSFNVLYWPLKQFARGRLPVVPAIADAPVDVVPVDYVADTVLGLAGAPAGTYHAVAGEQAATVAEVIDLAAARFGVPAPEIVDPRVIDEALARPMGEAQRRALEQARIFFPYFRLGVRFDDRWARGILAPRGVATDPLHTYFDTLIDFAQRAAWGGRTGLTVTSSGVTVAA